MVSRGEYLEQARKELGEMDSNGMFHIIDNEYYSMVVKEIKDGKTISQEVFDSLTEGQRFHFNKHYNHRGDKVHNHN